jgi:hypothetical protein
MSHTADPLLSDHLSESDKERARYHMGYLETEFAPSIVAGVPQPLQTVFLLEDALNRIVNQYSVRRVRGILCTLDTIEAKMREALCQIGVMRLGDLELHPLKEKGRLATDSLEVEYRRWASRLADVLGAPKYLYSDRSHKSGPGTVLSVRS